MNEFSKKLWERISLGPKHQTYPAPTRDILVEAAFVASSAPHHSETLPFRFVEIQNREKLADLFLSNIESPNQEQIEKARKKANKGPCLVGLVVKKDNNLRLQLEHSASAGAALMNFLHVLRDSGFAAKTVSADEYKEPKGLYNPDGETLLAWILIGTPDELTKRDIVVKAPFSVWN